MWYQVTILFASVLGCLTGPYRGLSTGDATIGSPCIYDSDCFTEHAYCEGHSHCLCKHNYVPSDDSEQCIATVGAICDSKHDCTSTLEHSTCTDRMCTCEDNYVTDPTGSSCLSVVYQQMGPCQQANQCQKYLGDAGTCRDGHCNCGIGFHFSSSQPSGSKCQRNKGLSEGCHSSNECYLGDRWANMVDCIGGKCQCKQGFHQTPDNKCAVGEGVQTRPLPIALAITIATLVQVFH